MCGSNINEHTILVKRINKSQGAFPQKKAGITTTIVRCNNCQLVFSNPLPIPANLQDHYGVPPENYWKPEYFEMDPYYFKNEIETLKTLKNIELNAKALDIGAGLGKCMIALKNAGFDAYGLEPSKPFYQQAIDKLHIPESKLKLCSIEEAEYPENEFDFITFGAVLEHLYNPSDSIKKAIKWLKPGGIIHIEVPSSKWFINRLINFAYSIRGLDYVANISPMHTPFHLYEFGIKSFELNGIANKYSIIHQQHFGCDTYMPKVIDVIAKPYMKITNTGMQLVVWL
ncbi:MAG: class I SAM-dependent methyltransferase, partial [Chitinophagaceae bacterium]|nr:class I SAM-dependent methyltransferase [Chitinophagaceae bacterium]